MKMKLGPYIASIAAAGTMLLAAPSYARHELAVVGGSGDKTARAQCPKGQMLAGFSGRTGMWVDQIQMVCAKPGAQPVATGARFGGSGGGAKDGFCPHTWDMLNHASLNMTTRERQVASINFSCRSRATGETMDMSFGNPGYVARCPGIGVGDCPIDPLTSQNCPADEVVLGFNVRYGKDVNAIGLICGRL